MREGPIPAVQAVGIFWGGEGRPLRGIFPRPRPYWPYRVCGTGLPRVLERAKEAHV